MSNEWVLGILLAAIIAVGGFAKVFIVAFVESKAKDFATKKDFEKILDETRRLTSETEQIKSRISYDLWDRQARFQIKREIIVQILENIAALHRAVVELDIIVEQGRPPTDVEVREHKKRLSDWHDESSRIEAIAYLVLSPATYATFIHAKRDATMANESGNRGAFKNAIRAMRDAVVLAGRKELGFDGESRIDDAQDG